ncbi:MAG: hypothetical protein AAB546_01805 [Patescibacteria group bacterium]
MNTEIDFYHHISTPDTELPGPGMILLIKGIKEMYGLGLKESKELVQGFIDRGLLIPQEDGNWTYNSDGDHSRLAKLMEQEDLELARITHEAQTKIAGYIECLGYGYVASLVASLKPEGSDE